MLFRRLVSQVLQRNFSTRYYEIPERYKNAFYLANASFFDDVSWFLHRAYEVCFSDLVENLLKTDKSLDENQAITKVRNLISIYEQCNYIIDVRFPVKRENGEYELVRGFRSHHGLFSGFYPCLGGLRIDDSITRDHMKALAAHSTYKHACMGISLAGAHGGIKINPFEYTEKERSHIVQQYATELYKKGFCGGQNDILEPDINTGALEMSWIAEAYSRNIEGAIQGKRGRGRPKLAYFDQIKKDVKKETYKEVKELAQDRIRWRAVSSQSLGQNNTVNNTASVGKPSMMDGLPNFEKTASQGAYFALDYFLSEKDIMRNLKMTPGIKNKCFIIEGLGKVGSQLAQYLENAGAMCVGVKEADGYIYEATGLCVKELLKYKQKYGSITFFEGIKPYQGAHIYKEDCDILVLAARQKSLMCHIADEVKAKVILEAANGPLPPLSHRILTDRNKLVIPDIYACSGASVASYLEYLLNLKQNQIEILRYSKGLYRNILEFLESRRTYGVVSSNTTQKISDSSMDSDTLTYLIESVMVETANEIMNVVKDYNLGLDVKTAAYIIAINNIYRSIYELRKF